MGEDKRQVPAHPAGEQPLVAQEAPPATVTIDSWAGQIKVEWDPQAPLTPLGQASFFIEFLKVSGVFDALIADCPLHRTSPNAPSNRDVLGTLVLSVLAGHKRYAHVTALRADGVLPELLGIERILSEDAVRRGLAAIREADGTAWLQRHLDRCTEPLLGEGWALDADTTIKPLYGHQEGAVLGYNPKKPGRPSHTYHTFFLSHLRLVLDVDVMAGNQRTANHAAPGLWALLARIGRDRWPRLLRADKELRLRHAHGRLRGEGPALSHAAAADQERQARHRAPGRPQRLAGCGTGLAGHRHHAQALGLVGGAPCGAAAPAHQGRARARPSRRCSRPAAPVVSERRWRWRGL